MNSFYFYDFAPYIIRGLIIVIFLKYLYIAWVLSKQANAAMKAKLEEGFDKEAFYEKYRKIYEALPEEKKNQVKKQFHKEDTSGTIKTIAAPKPRYTEEYHFYTSQHTPYAILGITESDSKAQIKKRYRLLAYKWHPDRFGNMHLSTVELQQVTRISQIINLAYEVLSKEKRAA